MSILKKSNCESSARQTTFQSYTQSTGLITQRSIIVENPEFPEQSEGFQKTNSSRFERPLPFTIKKQQYSVPIKSYCCRLNKMQNKKSSNLSETLSRRHQTLHKSEDSAKAHGPACHHVTRLYHSLEGKQCRIASESSQKLRRTFHKKQKKHPHLSKTQANEDFLSDFASNADSLISTKQSSGSSCFDSTDLRSYGVSTTAGQLEGRSKTQVVLVNLGLIKQFYLIECIEGSKTGMFLKNHLPTLLLKEYIELLKQERSGRWVGRKDKPPISQTPQISNSINQSSKETATSGQIKAKCLEIAVKKAIGQLNAQVEGMQVKTLDNSGALLSIVLIIDSYILTVSCGTGSTALFTKHEKIIESSQPHSTENPEEVDRIVEKGRRIYRTEFNVKNRSDLELHGPLRLFPSGLTYTRFLGKTHDKNKDESYYETSSGDTYQRDRLKSSSECLFSEPQLFFMSSKDIQWAIICSEEVRKLLGLTLICSIVLNELTKYSLTFTIHDLAGECSRRILHQAIIKGLKHSGTVQVLFLNTVKANLQSRWDEFDSKPAIAEFEMNRKPQKLEKQPSLRYIGGRKHFCTYMPGTLRTTNPQ